MPAGVSELFSLDGRVAVVTGATGVLGGAMARGLARAGAKVAILGRREQRAREVAFGIEKEEGEAIPLPADVLDGSSLERAREEVLREWGRVDILVNAAGGNAPEAITSPRKSFFEVEKAAIEQVVDLNLMGTILPSKIFGEAMVRAEEPEGSIVNVSSMAAQRPLSGVAAYAAAKAAVENFTRWLAVELARAYGEGLRVNAIAPGFFVGEQNRRLLLDEEGNLTARGEKIIEHTPAGRFGEPDDLVGTVVWLCGPSARFVSGAVIPVDGGFGAFAGV
ncbi:SDR family oxidoreductase [Rubrobacter calidifluminis]|uniref:SDR family oxidoreductase n=1 Tax=Rubrobacter calidifluminis TaxID=1392640 RepID=UPI002362014B|nr:SDR family oxidoreductase [Rubrobacter calidifluminis]